MTALLQTARLVLRPRTPNDIEHELRMRAHANVPTYIHPVEDRETLLHRYVLDAQALPESGQGCFAITLRSDDAMIGWIALRHDWDLGGISLSYHVESPYQNRGIATEACRRILEFAAAEHAITPIYAAVDPANAASERVLQKSGMRYHQQMEWDCPSGWAHIYIREPDGIAQTARV